MNTLRNTKSLALLGVLLAIEMILNFTPLGLIPLGFMNATTLHIPVIIGAIFLGPIGGGILGAAFGILSVITNTIRPNITSFVFSPFITISNTSGNFTSLIIAIVPRILIGVIAYYIYKWVSKKCKNKITAYSLAALAGSLTNTIFVMSGIYLFFGQAYAEAKGYAFEALFGVILSVIGINGIPEAIVAAIVVSTICKVLSQVYKKKA
ncbi:MAG: ECF transporter S component [Candidatus Cellulosilyticum pullistercoris]|uniref:ECF transporter S component n=1 Tax=Candidatus Cellulosilyticum pullistercoris TaxID=2838521 RepID=A0A9E2KCG3_9FIRM|nr:ECF transporter S component [Candidatus Cellulosilyticum pullistercoris]